MFQIVGLLSDRDNAVCVCCVADCKNGICICTVFNTSSDAY
jgi:hypothetical protein